MASTIRPEEAGFWRVDGLVAVDEVLEEVFQLVGNETGTSDVASGWSLPFAIG